MNNQGKIDMYYRVHQNLHEVIMDTKRIRFNPNKISVNDIIKGNFIISLHKQLNRTWNINGIKFKSIQEIEPKPNLISE